MPARRTLLPVVLIRAASKEFGSDGITMKAYCPGVVGPDMWAEMIGVAEITGATIDASYEKFLSGIGV